MSRPTRLLPLLLLAFPMTAPGQGSANLSPSLRGKPLAQDATGQSVGAPAVTAPKQTVVPPTAAAPAPPAATPAPATPGLTPGTTPAPATPAPPAATPAPATPGLAPGTTPRPPVTIPGRTSPPGGRARNGPGLAPAPGAATGTAEATEENGMWEIAFKDATIEEVIGKYEEISGRHVLRGPNLQAQLTFASNPQSPLAPAEAIEFLKAGLLLQGVVIQPYSKNIDKALMLQGLGNSPLTEPPKDGGIIYTKLADLPEEEQPVSYLLTLKHLPVDEASQVLAQAIPNHQWTKLIAVPSSNSLFVHESVSNVRTLVRAVEKMDLPPVKLVHQWVELERASAEDVQSILDQILQAQAQGKGRSGSTGFRSISPAAAAANLQPGALAQPVVAQAAPGAASGQMPDGSNMIVKADPRTNRVFLNGPEEHVEYLRKLIREFDEPSRVKNLLTQQLRYIPVAEFFDLAVTSLEATGAGQAGSGGGASSSGGGSARTTGGRSEAGDFGSGTAGGNARSSIANRGSSSSSARGGSSGGRSTRQSVGSAGGAGGGTTDPPRAQTVGKTLLISDPRTNSLIVSGPPDSIQRVSDLVKEMDRRPFQVHINAVIAQMSIGDNMDTSIDFLRKVETLDIGGESVNAAGFFRSGPNGAFIDPSTLSTLAAFPATGSGFNLYAAAGDLFNAYVRALETSSNSKLLAKPHITIANNELGTISSGERVPIPSNQQSTIVTGGTQSLNSSIEYENVVLSLGVTPLINSKNEITLTVDQLNDTINGETVINGNAIPNIATQELNTRITVPNGAILVLGGLISDSDSKSQSGLPFLSKVPVLKYLTGSNNRDKRRRELVVLLQARIIETADDMVDVNVSELQRTVVGSEAIEFAKPERITKDVVLPTYEKDVPFDTPDAGLPVEVQSATPRKNKERK